MPRSPPSPRRAAAQDWPNRTITLIVPFAPGGGIDASARLQALVLGEILGQTIVVENVGAAAGTIGSGRVAKAAPDGYTFLVGNSGTHAYSQSLYKKKPYDSLEDFEPVGMVTESPRLLVARKGLPVNNLQELVAYMKANQAKMQYSSAGVGSGTHLPCALLNFTLGVNITHVPYRGEGPALQDVIADRIDYMCTTIQSGAVQAKQGTVKGIAVMAPRRAAIIPDLATTGEQGLAGVEATVWNGFFFPKGTPKPIVDKMNKALETMIARPGHAQEAGGPRPRNPAAGAAHAGLSRQVPEGGHRALGQGHQGGRHQRGLIARGSTQPQEHNLRVVVVAPLHLLEALRRLEPRVRRLLHHDERAGHEPAAVARRSERLFRQSLAVGRIEERQRERLQRAAPGRAWSRRGDRPCVAPPAPSASTLPRSSARASAPSSTNSTNAAPRDSASKPSAPVPANRSSTRAPVDRIAVGMGEDVEQRLAQPVGGRPDRLRFRRVQRAPAKPPADDAHQRSRLP